METVFSIYFYLVIGLAIGQALAEIQNGVFLPFKDQ